MTATTIRVQMAQRKDTAANWTAANPILLSGEIGYETDTKKFKIGNGSINWNSLAYLPIPDGSGNLTITGNLEIGSTGSLTFEGSTADGFETTLAVTNPTADRTITLPDRSGTVITSGDTGTVTSTMILDGTIVNGDVNASAAIAGTKITPDFGAQTITTTGVVSAAVGAAATPSITFTGDTNTGIYSPGADQVAISTGGSGRLFVDASGRLGVGTSSPTAPLSFGANVPANNQTLLIYETGNYKAGLGISNLGQRMFTSEGSALFFGHVSSSDGTTFSEKVTIDGSGRLGIGTTSPVRALDVNGSIQLPSNNALYINGSANYLYADSSATELASATSIKFVANSVERARIDSSGRLLVGTSSAYAVASGFSGVVQQIVGNDAASFLRYSADSSSETLWFCKSRNATLGQHAVLQSGDGIARFNFQGSDGTNFITAARIDAEVDGTPGANDMPGRLVFSTTADGASSPTERMRITQNGLLLVNATSSAFGTSHQIDAAGTGSGDNALVLRHLAAGDNVRGLIISAPNCSTDGGYFIIGARGAASTFQVYTNGNVQNTNNAYGAISDVKLKENIVDATSQWSDIKALQVRKYNFKEGRTHTQIGLVAQEVELVSPGLVSESPDRDDEGNDLGTVTKSVNYSVLYMKAVKALQEAMERIEVLEQRLADAGIA